MFFSPAHKNFLQKKTFFCKQFAKIWAQKQRDSEIGLLLYFPISDFLSFAKEGTLLENVSHFYLQNQLGFEQNSQHNLLFQQIISQKSESGELVWIFDGWDRLEECEEEKKQLAKEICEFIENDPLTSKSIITCRTETVTLPSYEKHFLICGVDTSQLTEFISEFFSANPIIQQNEAFINSKDVSIEKVTLFLLDTQMISKCLHHPLLLKLICTKVNEMILSVHLLEERSIMESVVSSVIERNISSKQKIVFHLLAQIASSAQRQENVLLSHKNLLKLLKENKVVELNELKSCGLLRRMTSTKQETFWCLISSGVQQFLHCKFQTLLQQNRVTDIDHVISDAPRHKSSVIFLFPFFLKLCEFFTFFYKKYLHYNRKSQRFPLESCSKTLFI